MLQFGGLVKSVTFVCRKVTVFSSVLRCTIIVMCNYLQLLNKELLTIYLVQNFVQFILDHPIKTLQYTMATMMHENWFSDVCTDLLKLSVTARKR